MLKWSPIPLMRYICGAILGHFFSAAEPHRSTYTHGLIRRTRLKNVLLGDMFLFFKTHEKIFGNEKPVCCIISFLCVSLKRARWCGSRFKKRFRVMFRFYFDIVGSHDLDNANIFIAFFFLLISNADPWIIGPIRTRKLQAFEPHEPAALWTICCSQSRASSFFIIQHLFLGPITA